MIGLVQRMSVNWRMDKQEAPWYQLSNTNAIDSPALLIYAERVRQNIAAAVQIAGSAARLRPHVKTHKSAAVTQLLLDAGITAFKCSTIAEAEMLAQEQAPDILLAYQPVGPKVSRFLDLIATYPHSRFSCLVDTQESAATLNEAASSVNARLAIYIDINVGMNRTGIVPGEPAKALVEFLKTCANLELRGLHAYDGHIGDADLPLRTQRVAAAFAPLFTLLTELQNEGFKKLEIVAGGMPSFAILAKQQQVVLSPGTFVFWDSNYGDKLTDLPFVPAALVLSRIISKPVANRVTTDLGHKSIASENTLTNRVRFLNARGLVAAGHSEEHLVLEGDETANLPIGTVLYGLPFHICPTVALYENAVVIEQGEPVANWPITARVRRLSI